MPSNAYTSNAVPHGGIFVEVYRDRNNPVLLGNYLVESISVTQTAVLIERKDFDGGDNGWAIVNGTIEGSITIQLATNVTPSLQNGDFFSASIRRDINGNAVAERFVIHGMARPMGTTEYAKQTGSVKVDQFTTAGPPTPEPEPEPEGLMGPGGDSIHGVGGEIIEPVSL